MVGLLLAEQQNYRKTLLVCYSGEDVSFMLGKPVLHISNHRSLLDFFQQKRNLCSLGLELNIAVAREYIFLPGIERSLEKAGILRVPYSETSNQDKATKFRSDIALAVSSQKKFCFILKVGEFIKGE